MPDRSDHEQATAGGWNRWRAGVGLPWEQSDRHFGPFWLRISKRDAYEDLWEIDLFKVTAYTQMRSPGIEGVERHALRWAYPLIAKAYAEIELALRNEVFGT